MEKPKATTSYVGQRTQVQQREFRTYHEMYRNVTNRNHTPQIQAHISEPPDNEIGIKRGDEMGDEGEAMEVVIEPGEEMRMVEGMSHTEPSETEEEMMVDKGAGSREFCAVMKDLRKTHNFHIMAIVEPRVSGVKADKIVEQLNFESSCRVEAQGMSGGSNEKWLFTVVYANPNAILKKQCFEEVAKLASGVRLPWMVIGDFNEILMADEKIRGAAVDNQRCYHFARWVQECQLIDLGSKGPKFTWRGGCRNDVLVLPRYKSDHHPILVELKEMGTRISNSERPFRFEAAWIHHNEFAKFLEVNWETATKISPL
uniref:Endonuclease/exonuclease/phosphatase domain-containing protein n=1 Tax=Salix viminalis TaxID=40686 RepID=A0A6N2N2Q5_SALVM